jgi:Tfp pilus assembly protein PilN
VLYLNHNKRKEVITRPRTKGSKNRPKTNNDYASQIVEKQETISSLNTEIASIQKAIEEQKNTLKKAEKEVASLEAKKAKADARAAEEAKKVEAEVVLKKLLVSGMSADEILEKLK